MATLHKDINACTFTGRVSNDPVYGNGEYGSWVFFNLAVHQLSYDPEQKKLIEMPFFINCVAYDDIADKIGKSISKGMQVMVSGMLCVQSAYYKAAGYAPERFYLQIRDIDTGKTPLESRTNYRPPVWSSPPLPQ